MLTKADVAGRPRGEHDVGRGPKSWARVAPVDGGSRSTRITLGSLGEADGEARVVVARGITVADRDLRPASARSPVELSAHRDVAAVAGSLEIDEADVAIGEDATSRRRAAAGQVERGREDQRPRGGRRSCEG